LRYFNIASQEPLLQIIFT